MGGGLKIDTEYDLCYTTCIQNEELAPYILDFFDLLDIPREKLVWIKQPTLYDEIIIPDNCFWGTDWKFRNFTPEYISLIKHIKKKVADMSFPDDLFHEKVYFSDLKFREQKKKKHWYSFPYNQNVEELEEVFKKEGYRIYTPTDYSVAEQIAILMHCKYFATTEGSISHSIVFCEPNTEVAILKKNDFNNPWQEAVNRASMCKVTFLNTNKSRGGINPRGEFLAGPFYMCITKDLEQYLGHSIHHVPYLLRPSYLWYQHFDNIIIRGILKMFRCGRSIYNLLY